MAQQATSPLRPGELVKVNFATTPFKIVMDSFAHAWNPVMNNTQKEEVLNITRLLAILSPFQYDANFMKYMYKREYSKLLYHFIMHFQNAPEEPYHEDNVTTILRHETIVPADWPRKSKEIWDSIKTWVGTQFQVLSFFRAVPPSNKRDETSRLQNQRSLQAVFANVQPLLDLWERIISKMPFELIQNDLLKEISPYSVSRTGYNSPSPLVSTKGTIDFIQSKSRAHVIRLLFFIFFMLSPQQLKSIFNKAGFHMDSSLFTTPEIRTTERTEGERSEGRARTRSVPTSRAKTQSLPVAQTPFSPYETPSARPFRPAAPVTFNLPASQIGTPMIPKTPVSAPVVFGAPRGGPRLAPSEIFRPSTQASVISGIFF
jgi:hypothetical protein